MDEKIRRCGCGGKEFVRLKFGGAVFGLSWPSKVNFLDINSFKPEVRACRDCGEIHFFAPSVEAFNLEAESCGRIR